MANDPAIVVAFRALLYFCGYVATVFAFPLKATFKIGHVVATAEIFEEQNPNMCLYAICAVGRLLTLNLIPFFWLAYAAAMPVLAYVLSPEDNATINAVIFAVLSFVLCAGGLGAWPHLCAALDWIEVDKDEFAMVWGIGSSWLDLFALLGVVVIFGGVVRVPNFFYTLWTPATNGKSLAVRSLIIADAIFTLVDLILLPAWLVNLIIVWRWGIVRKELKFDEISGLDMESRFERRAYVVVHAVLGLLSIFALLLALLMFLAPHRLYIAYKRIKAKSTSDIDAKFFILVEESGSAVVDLPFMLMTLLSIVTVVRAVPMFRVLRRALVEERRANDVRGDIFFETIMAGVDITCAVFMVFLVLSVYRLRFLYAHFKSVRWRWWGDDCEMQLGIFLQFICLIIDIPFIFCGVLASLTLYRLPVLYYLTVVEDDKHNFVERRMRVAAQLIFVFFDILTLPFLLVVCLTVYRFPKLEFLIMKRPRENATTLQKYADNMDHLFGHLLIVAACMLVCADLLCLLASGFLVFVPWRLYFLYGDIKHEYRESNFKFRAGCADDLSQESQWMSRFHVFKHVAIGIFDYPAMMASALVLASGWRTYHLYRDLKACYHGRKHGHMQFISDVMSTQGTDTTELPHIYVLRHFLGLILDVPFMLMTLLMTVTLWRARKVYSVIWEESTFNDNGKYFENDREEYSRRKIAVLGQFLLWVVDIPTGAALVIVIGTVWRAYHTYKMLTFYFDDEKKKENASEERRSVGGEATVAYGSTVDGTDAPTDTPRTDGTSDTSESSEARSTAVRREYDWLPSYAHEPHLIVWYNFFHLIIDIPFLVMSMLLVVAFWRIPCLYRILSDEHAEAMARRKLIAKQVVLLAIDPFVLVALIITVPSWRLNNLRRRLVGVDYRDDGFEFWGVVVTEGLEVMVDYLCIFVGLLCLWRLPVLLYDVLFNCRLASERRLVALVHVAKMFVDIFALIACALMIVTLWRVPNLFGAISSYWSTSARESRVARELLDSKLASVAANTGNLSTRERIDLENKYYNAYILRRWLAYPTPQTNIHLAVFNVFASWLLDLPFVVMAILPLVCVWRWIPIYQGYKESKADRARVDAEGNPITRPLDVWEIRLYVAFQAFMVFVDLFTAAGLLFMCVFPWRVYLYVIDVNERADDGWDLNTIEFRFYMLHHLLLMTTDLFAIVGILLLLPAFWRYTTLHHALRRDIDYESYHASSAVLFVLIQAAYDYVNLFEMVFTLVTIMAAPELVGGLTTGMKTWNQRSRERRDLRRSFRERKRAATDKRELQRIQREERSALYSAANDPIIIDNDPTSYATHKATQFNQRGVLSEDGPDYPLSLSYFRSIIHYAFGQAIFRLPHLLVLPLKILGLLTVWIPMLAAYIVPKSNLHFYKSQYDPERTDISFVVYPVRYLYHLSRVRINVWELEQVFFCNLVVLTCGILYILGNVISFAFGLFVCIATLGAVAYKESFHNFDFWSSKPRRILLVLYSFLQLVTLPVLVYALFFTVVVIPLLATASIQDVPVATYNIFSADLWVAHYYVSKGLLAGIYIAVIVVMSVALHNMYNFWYVQAEHIYRPWSFVGYVIAYIYVAVQEHRALFYYKKGLALLTRWCKDHNFCSCGDMLLTLCTIIWAFWPNAIPIATEVYYLFFLTGLISLYLVYHGYHTVRDNWSEWGDKDKYDTLEESEYKSIDFLKQEFGYDFEAGRRAERERIAREIEEAERNRVRAVDDYD